MSRGCSASCACTLAASSSWRIRDEEHFLWVIDLLFQLDEDTGRWTFMHHPFTAPVAGHEELVEGDPPTALSQHYDSIWNGWERRLGSIRIHDPEVQRSVFRTMASERGQAREKFGFLLDAHSRWARRRTRGSRWASTASWR